MLATAGPLPVGPDWTYEVKWDGHRAVYADGGFVGRSGRRLAGEALLDLPLERRREQLRLLLLLLEEPGRPDSPFEGRLPEPAWILRQARWVEPVLVVEVRFGELTEDGRLRSPVLLRLRPDESPQERVDAG